MFKRENVSIGLSGLAFAVLLLILSVGSNNNRELELFGVLAAITLAAFFIAFIFKGLRSGILFGIYAVFFCGVIAAPNQIRGLFLLLFYVAIFIGPIFFGGKRTNGSPEDAAVMPGESCEREEEKGDVFCDALYLIIPRSLKPDVTCKVVDKGDHLYFCRCGGPSYDIDPDIAEKAYMSDQELLAHKDSFRIKKDEITSVEINSEKWIWAKNSLNNGSVIIMAKDKRRFLIHLVNDYRQAHAFFEAALDCPVTVSIDPKRGKTEDIDAEFEKQDHEVKSRIKKFSDILSAAGIATFLWLIIFPRPILLAVGVGVALPILGLLLYTFSKKHISISDAEYGTAPEVFTVIMAPSLALLIISIFRVDVIYDLKLWATIILTTILFSILVLYKTRERKKEKLVIILLPVLIFVYFFGAIITTNCCYDYHEPALYSVQALDKKYVKGNRTDEYTLTIARWNGKGPVKASVSEEIYNGVKTGQDVWVVVSPGLWGIEWYYVLP